MREPIKVYPPGGGVPVTPHPTKVDEMLEKGWTLENTEKAPVKSKKVTKES